MSFLFEKKNKIKETTCLLSNARDENERVVLRETNWEEEEEWDREEKKKTNRSTHYDDFNSIWVFAEKKKNEWWNGSGKKRTKQDAIDSIWC